MKVRPIGRPSSPVCGPASTNAQSRSSPSTPPRAGLHRRHRRQGQRAHLAAMICHPACATFWSAQRCNPTARRRREGSAMSNPLPSSRLMPEGSLRGYEPGCLRGGSLCRRGRRSDSRLLLQMIVQFGRRITERPAEAPADEPNH